MSKRYYEVDVRRIEIGSIIVEASSEEDAMARIRDNTFTPVQSEFFTSVNLMPIEARESDTLPKYMQQPEEIY